MKKAWIFLADRFDALQPRERMAVFAVLAALLVGLFFFLVLNPGYVRTQLARNSLKQSEQMLEAARASELALLQSASLDPDAEARRLIAKISDSNDMLRNKLANTQAQLASPEKMTEVLRDFIAAQKGVELVSMRTEPAEDLLARIAEEQAKAQAQTQAQALLDGTKAVTPIAPVTPRAPAATKNSLYRHGIEVSVRGDYQALAGYLRRVETLPWKVQLTDMSLKTSVYPQATMKLTLYTLSLERAWLSF
jgi:MSHA biogenesis protein MshJ